MFCLSIYRYLQKKRERHKCSLDLAETKAKLDILSELCRSLKDPLTKVGDKIPDITGDSVSLSRNPCGHDGMVVGFITICPINAF